MSAAYLLETPRMYLRQPGEGDESFVLELLNSPGWIQWIGDRGIRTPDEAAHYIRSGPQKSFRENGFGLCVLVLKSNRKCIGLCGLIKREELPAPDLGFALLPAYYRQGYTREAAKAVIRSASRFPDIQELKAIVVPENTASVQLLLQLGFTEDGIHITPDTQERLLRFSLMLQK